MQLSKKNLNKNLYKLKYQIHFLKSRKVLTSANEIVHQESWGSTILSGEEFAIWSGIGKSNLLFS